MKTAQCKYPLAGMDVNLGLYFDPKAFDFIRPPMGKDEEDDFIRLICDSFAAAMPKVNADKNFYIKRALKNPEKNILTLLCTDGFLLDDDLILPISQQAYSKERIKIGDIDQLPSRLGFSIEMLKNINDKLSLFEEQALKGLSTEKVMATKEVARPEATPATTVREFTADRAFDVLAEAAHIKREIRELTENSINILNTLMGQINDIHKRIHENVTKETEKGLTSEDNKKKLSEFALSMASQVSGGDLAKSKELLTQKIQEITPIYPEFANDVDEITQHISRQTDVLALFKQQIINALYESAKQYHEVLSKQLQSAAPLAKKTLLIEFNKKFFGVATLSENGELSSLAQAQENLGKLSFDDIQTFISNDDKENPGLLQKCNTSWTEESPELQILVKNLGQVNTTLAALFKDDMQFSQYADQDMIEIVRTPFPRSYQFKFSSSAIGYKKAVEDFCKTQKENITSMANKYKKIIQVDDVRDKTRRALAEIQKPADILQPVTEFKDLLKRKEISNTIIASANKEHALTEKYLDIANQLQDLTNNKIDAELKTLNKKINILIQQIRDKTDATNKTMQQLMNRKSQIDMMINNFSSRPSEKPNMSDVDEKLKSMEVLRKNLTEENKQLKSLDNSIAAYENLPKLNEKVARYIAQTDMRQQQNEAKAFLLQLMKDQTLDPIATEPLKKEMITVYSKIDMNVSDIYKILSDVTKIKNTIFADFNSKDDVPAEQLQNSLQTIDEKLQAVESAKLAINENLEELRKLSLEVGKK